MAAREKTDSIRAESIHFSVSLVLWAWRSAWDSQVWERAWTWMRGRGDLDLLEFGRFTCNVFNEDLYLLNLLKAHHTPRVS